MIRFVWGPFSKEPRWPLLNLFKEFFQKKFKVKNDRGQVEAFL